MLAPRIIRTRTSHRRVIDIGPVPIWTLFTRPLTPPNQNVPNITVCYGWCIVRAPRSRNSRQLEKRRGPMSPGFHAPPLRRIHRFDSLPKSAVSFRAHAVSPFPHHLRGGAFVGIVHSRLPKKLIANGKTGPHGLSAASRRSDLRRSALCAGHRGTLASHDVGRRAAGNRLIFGAIAWP